MKIQFKSLPALLLLLYYAPLHASHINPAHYPQELIFLNKPIDPLCLTFENGAQEDIDLNKCGMTKEHYSVDGTNDYFTKKGCYGWDWRDVSEGYVSKGYSYYQAWDAGNHKYWIVTYFSGGGTGQFSSVSLLSRKDYHTVKFETLDNGDRCNGGVNDVNVKNNKLQYDINITPRALLDISNDNPDKVKKEYDGIYDCAVCCTADAVYEADQNGKSKLLYVDLSTHNKDNSIEDEEKDQVCFDKLLLSYIAKGETKLDPVKLNEFVKKFNETCIK
jgi:hypothetical protein